MTNSDGSHVTTPNGSEVTTPATTAPTVPPTAAPTTATSPVTAAPVVTRWKLALDYRTHPGTNPFAATSVVRRCGACARARACATTATTACFRVSRRRSGRAVSAWHATTFGCESPPAIGTDTVDVQLSVCGAVIPGGAAFVYPAATHMPVVAWTSPFAGNVRITGGVADLDKNCGDGVRFYVDRGTTRLTALTITNGQAYTVPTITHARRQRRVGVLHRRRRRRRQHRLRHHAAADHGRSRR